MLQIVVFSKPTPVIDSLRTRDALVNYVNIGSDNVLIVACVIEAKPISEPMLNYPL